MVLRSAASETRVEAGTTTSTGSVRWDCECGRSFVDFQSAAALAIEVETEGEQGSDYGLR
jgi:hypothetical protein